VADKRTFRYALAGSVALHVLLLLPLSPAVPRLEGRAAPFTVRLTQPVQAESRKELPRPRVAKALPRPAAKTEQIATEVPEAVSRDQYRIELMAEALRQARERHPPKGYPQLARDNQWEGDVQVGVVVSASGGTTLTLKGGSGYEALDEQALELLRQAARAVAVPHTLRGKDFAIDVRASYRLGD
jgi:TonB family protein